MVQPTRMVGTCCAHACVHEAAEPASDVIAANAIATVLVIVFPAVAPLPKELWRVILDKAYQQAFALVISHDVARGRRCSACRSDRLACAGCMKSHNFRLKTFSNLVRAQHHARSATRSVSRSAHAAIRLAR